MRLSAQKSMISSFRRLGSIEPIRRRFNPSIWSSALSKSRKVSPVVRPKSPTLTPVRTISSPPSAMIRLASETMSTIEPFRLRPRAAGIVQ